MVKYIKDKMFNLDEEFRKLKERGPNNPLPLSKMAKITAGALDQGASQWAFHLFRDKRFRQLVNFEKLEKIEQDRIFNELVVSGLVLLMITLESPDLRVPEELKEYFLMVKEELPSSHTNLLTSYGIEKKYLADWDKLIKMRYEEYNKDKLEIRKAAMEMDSKKEDLTLKGLGNIQLLLPVQTVAIGCHHHICRGKTEGKDELFKLILKRMGRFYVEIRVPLEGGKINFWSKLRVKTRHFLSRFKP